MKIQYCSDLHLEFEKNSRYLQDKPLEVCGDVLILAGDIIPLHDEFFNNPFFSFIADNYNEVFWIPGNHEFYFKDITEYSPSYTIKLKSNISIVNNVVIDYQNVHFIFSTLWSKISSKNEKTIEQCVFDFSCITHNGKKLRAGDFNRLHAQSLSFLKEALRDKNEKTLVVTHHLPSRLCNLPAHNNSLINEAFCTDLSHFVEESKSNFWIYGHSHFNQKPLLVGNTIMLTNQLGYIQNNEHGSFKHSAFFSI